MSSLPKKFDLFLCFGILYFSIIFVYSVPIEENLQRDNGKNYHHPFWTSILNQYYSKKAGQHSKRSGDLPNSSKIFGKLSKLPAKLYQSFTKKSRSTSSIEIDDLEPRISEKSAALDTAKASSKCIFGNGLQTGTEFLIEEWFKSFNRRHDRRGSNRRSLGRLASIDIGKAVTQCMLGSGISWGINNWWDSFKNDGSRA